MNIKIGDVVTLKILEVLPYACWSEFKGQIAFTHCTDWSVQRPIPDIFCPKVGQEIRAKVFYLTNISDKPLRPDVSLDGKYQVSFAASFALLENE